MGVTKSEIFTKEQNDLSRIAKVLGHPARIAILQHLIKINACVCGELVKEIGLAQPTISQHLRELKGIGLIQGTVSGTSVCYCINKEQWKETAQLMALFFSSFSPSEKCCDKDSKC